jgi:hypothetical protein
MASKITGNADEACRIIVVDESDWTREAMSEVESGAFEISGLSDGNKTVIARNSEGRISGYAGVTAEVYASYGTTWVRRNDPIVLGTPVANAKIGDPVAATSDGNTIVFGASNTNSQGLVYTFDYSEGSWSQRGSVLQEPTPTTNNYFGAGLAISKDGNVLAVGAGRGDGGATDAGTIYIYDRSGSSWSLRGSVNAPDPGGYDWFTPCALSNSGARLAVGAMGWDGGAGSSQGAAYIYDYTTSWSQLGSTLLSPDPSASEWFGECIAMDASGDVLVVGADGTDYDGYEDVGGLYTFDRDGSSWVQRGSVLVPSDYATQEYNGYGYYTALSSDGNVLFVGSIWWNDEGNNYPGAVYVYTRSGSSWSEDTIIEAPNTDSDFGRVACNGDGDVLFVGQPYYSNTQSNEGCIWVYDWV